MPIVICSKSDCLSRGRDGRCHVGQAVDMANAKALYQAVKECVKRLRLLKQKYPS